MLHNFPPWQIRHCGNRCCEKATLAVTGAAAWKCDSWSLPSPTAGNGMGKWSRFYLHLRTTYNSKKRKHHDSCIKHNCFTLQLQHLQMPFPANLTFSCSLLLQVFCILNPLIAPACMVYFGVVCILERYQHVYIWKRRYESGGRFWKQVTCADQAVPSPVH